LPFFPPSSSLRETKVIPGAVHNTPAVSEVKKEFKKLGKPCERRFTVSQTKLLNFPASQFQRLLARFGFFFTPRAGARKNLENDCTRNPAARCGASEHNDRQIPSLSF
jgi:hypothetical protein